MQKASIRSQIDSMTVELEDDQLLITTIHSAFVDLANSIQRDLINKSAGLISGDGQDGLLNSSQYLPVIMAVVNFAKSIKGFQLLFQNDRIHLLKVSICQLPVINTMF